MLPGCVLKGLTFSTYEFAPLNSSARVVGTVWAPDQARDLPLNCYSGSCVGYNHFNGKQSDLGGQSLYAQFAVKKLLQKEEKDINGFVSSLIKYDVRDINLVEPGFAVASDKCHQLTRRGHASTARSPGFAPKTVSKASGLARIVELGNTHAGFFRDDLPRALHLIDEQGVLQKVGNLADATQDRLENWLDREAFLRQPELSTKRLRSLTALIGQAPTAAQAAASSDLLDAVFRALFTLEKRMELQNEVEVILREFSSVTPGGIAAVYRGLWDRYLQRLDIQIRRPALIIALAAVGVGRGQSEGLAGEMADKLVEDMDHSLRELRREAKGGQSLRVVRNAVRRWSREQISRLPRFMRPSKWKVWLVCGIAVLAVLIAGGLVYAVATGKLSGKQPTKAPKARNHPEIFRPPGKTASRGS